MNGNAVSLGVRRALAGASLMMVCAVPVYAAEAEDSDLAEVVVTGSRVRGAEPVGSAVIALDRDALADAGQVTIDRIIKDLPQNFDLGVSENSRGQNGGAGNIVYGNTVNLRGVGPYATLIMVDGHRVTNNSRSTDPSILPTLAVGRVEVVADGASAIYGSDAVAGVVNIIPRRDLNGAEVFGRKGFTRNGDFKEAVYGAAVGKVWDSGQAMLAYEHVDRDNLSGDDRDFFVGDQRNSGGRDYRTTRCSPGTLVIGTTTYAIPATGLTTANAASLAAGTANRCNELTGQDLFPEQKYDSFGMTATQEATPWLTFFADGYYSNRSFYRRSAYASTRLTVPQTNAFFVRPTGFTGTSYSIDYNFAGDLPSNDSYGSAKNWQFTPGARIKLPHDWQLEALFGYGKTRDNSVSYNGTNNAALNAALASADPATALDPYGLHRTAPLVLAGIANQIFFAPTNSDFKGYELRLNGSLFTLPGGDLALAAGYERQENDVALGSARGAPTTALAWRYFGRNVNSGYAELQIPIVGASNARAGVRRLTLNAAVRHDKYSDVGSTTNEKFGATWRPVDNLAIRASYGTSFRAPLISQIYGNSNNLFVQSYQNPAGGAAITGVALSGQNLNLGPETATTWSTGFDWDINDDLRTSLTYFDIEYKGQVDSYLSNLAILAREADFAGTGIILRGAAAGARVQELINQGVVVVGALPGGSAANVTVFVDGRSQNLSVSRMKGFDLASSYRLRTDGFGSFTLSLSGTYLTDFNVGITAAATPADRLNTIFNPLQLKLRGAVNWNLGPWRASMVVNRVHGYQNNAVTPVESVGPYTPVDFTLNRDLTDLGGALAEGMDVGIEIRNAFDESPPYVNLAPSVNGSGGYDASTTNPVGRLFAISLRKKW
ncbi:MAG: TonB-dependent receptor [Gammaproteobacteria bacterium]|jgi:iron complex outermembrane receptor protein|nr:TonB-dependent receptor [Gammaproteobacteria bacterium]